MRAFIKLQEMGKGALQLSINQEETKKQQKLKSALCFCLQLFRLQLSTANSYIS